MYCTQCGSPNDEGAASCCSCGSPLQPPHMYAGAIPGFGLGPATAGVSLTQGIVVTLFCCMPTGIVAIVYAALAMGANSAGDYVLAHRHVKTSNLWSWISFGVVVVPITLWIVLVVATSVFP